MTAGASPDLPRRQHWPAAALQVGLAAAMLCGAAIYNRFPIADSDTGAYLLSAGTGHLDWVHSPIYSFFIFGVGGGVSLWAVVVAQSLIAAWLVRLALIAACGESPGAGRYLGLVGALCLLTSLPWETAKIMAEPFAGFVVLGQLLLGFAADRLRGGERAALLGLTTLAIAVHYSNVPLALGLAAAVIATKAGLAGRAALSTRLAARLLAPSLAVVTALVTLQGLTADRWTFSSAGPVMLLARLIADGPAVDFLRQACPERHFVLCDHLAELPLPVNQFLWAPNSILRRMGGPFAAAEEASAIVAGTLRFAPLRVLRAAAVNSLSQFARFQTAASAVPMLDRPGDPGSFTAVKLRTILPAQYAAYLQSRQSSGQLDLGGLRRVHRIVAWSAMAGLLALLPIAAARRDRAALALLVTVAAALVLNAALCGSLSEPIPRYQSRVVWLAPLAVLLVAARWLTLARDDRPGAAPARRW